MKPLKNLLVLLLCLVCFVGITACKEENPTTSTPSQSESSTGDNSSSNGDGDSLQGDSSHTHSYSVVVTEPTCTEQGYTTHSCSCGESYKDTYVDALNHEFLNYFYNEDATCLLDGTETATCSRKDCIEKDTRAKANSAKGHSYTNYVYNDDAKCGVNGTETATCENGCKEVDTRTKAGTALTHSFTNYVSDNNATYEKDGTKTAYCNHGCGTPNTVTDVGSMLVRNTLNFKTLTVNGTDVYGKLSNTTETFSFINEITTTGTTKYTVSLDIYGIQQVASKTIPLSVGDNVVYITETVDEEPVNVYTVTVRRKPMYNVTFNTNGGTAVASQTIEEDGLIVEPQTTKEGYTLTAWDYDFMQPVTGDKTVKASWTANTDTPYKVEYYLQNLENDNYTIKETSSLTGTTDTTADAIIKTYEHFTYNKDASKISGNIAGDGSLTLQIYYLRDCYSLSTYNYSAGSVTNTGTYKYGTTISCVTSTNIGYIFLGWYDGENWISSDVEYTFVVDSNLVAKFEVKEEMSDFYFTSSPTTCTITLLKNTAVSEVVVPDCVTGIGDKAFQNQKNLTKIEISRNVEYIGSYAFSGCSNLASVMLGEGVTEIGEDAFRECSKLLEIEIPNSVKVIGGGVFSNCISLKNIMIPDSVTSIGSIVFYGCSNLKYAEIGDGVKSIGSKMFYNCSSLVSATIGNGVESIGYEAFYGCQSLSSLTLPFVGASYTATGYEAVFGYIFGYTKRSDSLPITGATYQSTGTSDGCYHYYIPTSLTAVSITNGGISKYAFNQCKTLTKVEVSGGALISEYAFSGCRALEQVVISDDVTCISRYAFNCCSTLKSITLPKSLSKIDEGAFQGCSSLQDIEIPESVTDINDCAFQDCSSLTSITIHAGVENIGSRAFYNCSLLNRVFIDDLTTWCNINFDRDDAHPLYYGATLYLKNEPIYDLVIPNTVTEIKEYAFYNCKQLKSVNISDDVTGIGYAAFNGCDSLEKVTIGSGVTSIDYWAFDDCDLLMNVYYKGTLEEWTRISIDNSTNKPLINATIYFYSENEPPLNEDVTAYDGNYWHYDENGEVEIWKK